MFEQSLLIDPSETRKATSFAATLTAQTLVVGVLVIVPLLYHDVLPALRMPDYVPVLTPWNPPVTPPSTPQRTGRSNALAAPNPFRPLVVAHSDYPRTIATVLDDAPVIQGLQGVSALPLGPSTLPVIEVAPPPAKPAVATPLTDAPIRVGGDVLAARLLKRVVPLYPQTARQMRISGTVRLLGIIAKDGSIQKLQVLSGHPLLQQAALDAVSQWLYRATILNGQPVEVEAPIDVIFSLLP